MTGKYAQKSFSCNNFGADLQIGIQSLKQFIKEHKSHVVVLADKHTLQYCYPLLGADLPSFTVPYGEKYKNLNSCEFIWKKLIDIQASRDTILLCLGGGVVCDMGAFSAASFKRGISCVLVPTSLVGMVDAAHGGKNGVNFMGFKNYIGLFNEPAKVFTCPVFLKTLPHKEMVNGFVEMLKHGLIASQDHYNKVCMLFLQQNPVLDDQLILDSIAIKKIHTDADFTDNGIRKNLNYGHTIGHALESHSLEHRAENYSLSHGQAVALGIVAESYISHKMNGLPADEMNQISIVLQPVLSSINEPLPAFQTLLPYLLKDKKNSKAGINFSLLSEIGHCNFDRYIKVDIIEESLHYLQSQR